MEEPILKSSITGREYKLSNMVRIINPRQAALYIKNGVRPYHIYCDQFEVPGTKEVETRLAFLFDRGETKWCYDLWTKHELK